MKTLAAFLFVAMFAGSPVQTNRAAFKITFDRPAYKVGHMVTAQVRLNYGGTDAAAYQTYVHYDAGRLALRAIECSYNAPFPVAAVPIGTAWPGGGAGDLLLAAGIDFSSCPLGVAVDADVVTLRFDAIAAGAGNLIVFQNPIPGSPTQLSDCDAYAIPANTTDPAPISVY